MQLNPTWEFVSDRVMGGVSEGALSIASHEGQPVARLTGRVSLENNGGFVQMAFDVTPDGSALDASKWAGLEITLRGNGETYDIRLRTAQLTRPWQSFRTQVTATPSWRIARLPFDRFEPHRTTQSFDPAALRRIGVLAIGKVFEADISVAQVGFYR
ncbi:NADH:ubiquinone oxidoreductase complex i intermediate-associated protein 30 [Roseobacter denitrificans]|uniref:NADH:ubiquinone oxidoreductase intermediate-associated protein 30 domain-containing protein n=1 Tax=Roseobacter denitrificans (strain ATCC 33942 / OCh 114) TaxID=375451 RepID=Q160P4_ROSDO|nr:CIA30 family protein [Roseobacter denitrificans]ABG33549.1 conserved hypothetical protein [Roseobacter denitrificans OCh 114]AVL52861.1 NADH:ubiquinone oxidoreductase complex i intermediate-associated protein 30 [Roseobacter denitrificans]SFG04451.1 Complex I intermediate-associated protein 30 (CIA30) [Roseobacter denitrificans OCh 114]